MVVSRMGRSTDGKFVHRVIPVVLERELHSDKAINLLLCADILQWMKFHRFSLKNTSASVNFLNLLCEDVNRLHDRCAICLYHHSTVYAFLSQFPRSPG